MFGPLRIVLRRVVRRGRLTMIDADSRSWHFGPEAHPSVSVRLSDKATERALARDPYLALGEAYMDGRMVMEEGSVYDLLALLMHGAETTRMPAWVKGLEGLRRGLRRLEQYNPAGRARRNVAHHYDIDGSIYDLFLDADRQYSCAYFTPQLRANPDLDEAQLLKKRHIAAKLDLAPGQRILDIGSGWGGLGLYLAQMGNANVTGVTLSKEQIALARQRAEAAGLERSVRFEMIDYRSVEGSFDRIVSVGMFEHVGINH